MICSEDIFSSLAQQLPPQIRVDRLAYDGCCRVKHEPSTAESWDRGDEEESELKGLWRKLVKLFHPDRFADDPEKMATYTKLTGAINATKDSGDLETLRQIADDPHGFILRQGWMAIDLSDTDELEQLQKLFTSLETEIIAVIEATDALKESSDYELYQITEHEPEVFERVVGQQIAGLDTELTELKTEAERLKKEIVELCGEDAAVIG